MNMNGNRFMRIGQSRMTCKKFTRTVNRYIICTIAIFIIICCNNEKSSNKLCNSKPITLFDHPKEISDKYLITPDNSIVYSSNCSGFYSLTMYDGENYTNIFPSKTDIFYPAYISGEVSGMQDKNGDENFRLLNNKLKEYTGSESIKAIYTFEHGNIVFLQLKNDYNLYLIDIAKKEKRVVFYPVNRINGIVSGNTEASVLISCDNRLLFLNNFNNAPKEIATDLPSEKLNPFLYGDCAYFVNNSFSEYYKIYKINLESPPSDSSISVLELPGDIRMPKIRNDSLYFIEIINNEYILKRLNMIPGNIEEITREGVVYSFDFFKDDKLAIVYSDLMTPRTILIYDIDKKTFKNLTNSTIDHSIKSKLIKRENCNSGAYLLFNPETDIRGVILFFHPGTHSDFSPRWDTILMNLCNNGYVILAPNSPMSSGNGKTFLNAHIEDAINDTQYWKNYISDHYKDLPLYCLSMSSGNILMEKFLLKDHHKVNAAVSLFGIPVDGKSASSYVPTYFILGKKDPLINYKNRISMLSEEKRRNSGIVFTGYDNEGHWFRKNSNIQDAVTRIIDFLCQNSTHTRDR